MSARGAIRDGALWGSAAVVVLAAHLGGAMWILHHAQAATPPGLPDPVFVELAPLPEAAAPPEEIETPEMAEAAPEPEPEPQPEPEPEPTPDFVMDQPLPELEPLLDMNTLFPPPADAVVLQTARPKPRPERVEPEPEPEPKIVKKEPDPKKVEKKKEVAEQEQPARKATTTVRAQQSNRSAAPQTQGGQPSARQVATWQSKVQSTVNRHMQRARLKRGGVSVTVAFTINANGSVSGGRVTGSSGDAQTDAALARQAASLPRMAPHPSGKSIPITLPVTIKR